MNGNCVNRSYTHYGFNAKEIDRTTAKQTGDAGVECYVLLIWKTVLEVELQTYHLTVIMYKRTKI